MPEPFPADLVAAAASSAAWPFEEARKLVARIDKRANLQPQASAAE